jgi:adenosylhomocysteine nucleosidase
MAGPGNVRRVGMLAPMQPELQPIVRRLDMEGDGSVYRGRAGDLDVVAILTTIGMAAGAEAAQRILEHDVDWVMVVGIAGGVDRSVPIGGVVVPELVIDRATGGRFRPSHVGSIVPRGTLSCGDELITGQEELNGMAAGGVVAVDMETAAVAAVCVGAHCPWSVFRGISDYAGEGLVDDALFAMTRPDGTADPEVIARYLEANPERKQVLVRLAHDTSLATEAAAAAAIDACAALQKTQPA